MIKTLHDLSDGDVKQIMANRVAWVERLRTTTEPQTSGVLRRIGQPSDTCEPVGYCCLGIACEMVPGIEKIKDAGERVLLYDSSEGSLPDRAQDWLGVVDDDPFVDLTFYPRDGSYDQRMTCAGLNDNWQLTFPQIGDVIAYFGFSKKSDVLLGAEPY